MSTTATSDRKKRANDRVRENRNSESAFAIREDRHFAFVDAHMGPKVTVPPTRMRSAP